MQYESGVKRRDLKQEIFSMAGIQELVLTFLDSLSHDALRFNRKRETLDARIERSFGSNPFSNNYLRLLS